MMPKFTELMLPVLEIARLKREMKDVEAEQILAERFGLKQEELKKIKSSGGERLFLNKIRWAKTHLAMAKLLNKKRGCILISQRGIQTLESKPQKITEKFLSRFPEYREARGWNIRYERRFSMPNKWTFEMQPVAEFLDRNIEGKVLDPFSGKSTIANVRNDINPNTSAHCHLDALVFLKKIRTAFFDTVLVDGIYTPRQLKEAYDSVGLKLTNYQTSQAYFADIKDEIARVTRLGGKVISFGWNTNGLGMCRGFSLEEIMLVPHGANHNDTIVIVERKIENREMNSRVEKEARLNMSLEAFV